MVIDVERFSGTRSFTTSVPLKVIVLSEGLSAHTKTFKPVSQGNSQHDAPGRAPRYVSTRTSDEARHGLNVRS